MTLFKWIKRLKENSPTDHYDHRTKWWYHYYYDDYHHYCQDYNGTYIFVHISFDSLFILVVKAE